MTEGDVANYRAQRAEIVVERPGSAAMTLYPERRWYPVAKSQTTNTAIATNGFGDLYLALGDRTAKAAGYCAPITTRSFHGSGLAQSSPPWAGWSRSAIAGCACMRKRPEPRPSPCPWIAGWIGGFRMIRRLLLAAALLTALGTAAHAVEPSERLADPALEARARALSQELRCLVCQNQSIDEFERRPRP